MNKQINSSSNKGIITIIIIAVFMFLMAGPIYLKIYLDNKIMENLLGKRTNPQVKKIKYNEQYFTFCLKELELWQHPNLSYNDLGVELPVILQFYVRWGFDQIHINEGQRKYMMEYPIQNLKNMSGEDFGQDVEKWRTWKRQKNAEIESNDFAGSNEEDK